MKTKQILEQSTFENKVLKLPEIQLDRKEYMSFAKDMEFLGGKWKGGKTAGFIFDKLKSIDEILDLMEAGENKKDLQFFATPDEVARELVDLAEVNNSVSILEPSAGRGAIIKAIQEQCEARVSYCEISSINQKYLDDIDNITKVGDDFLLIKKKFDRIIANPPFSKNQDITHIMKMWDCLKDGGIIVSIASCHWEKSSEKKCVEFRQFLHYTNAEIIDVSAGAFKNSGTMVGAKIIIIKNF